MTDTELLQQFVTENRDDAFSELVHRRIDLVYAAALRQLGGDAHRAADITQQVFIDLARKARTLTSHPSLLAWLYTSTHYAARKFIRTEQRRQRREEEAHAMENLTPPSAPATDWEQLRPVLDRAMHDLSERDRRIVLLRFFAQQSFAAIAAELGITENAAQKSADRALDKLHALLARHGITSTGAALAAAFANQTATAAPAGLAASVAATALIHATAASGLTALALNLMNTSKITLGLTAAALLCVGTGAYVSIRSARAETTLASVNHDTDELLTRLRAARRQITAIPPPFPALTSVSAVTSTPSSAGAGAPTAKPAPLTAEQRQARDAAIRDLISDPRYNQFKAQFGASYVRLDWGLYCSAMGMNGEQRASFEKLMTQAIAEAWQTRVDGRLAGRDEKDPVTQELLAQARVRLEEGIRGLTGESGLERFLEFERMETPTGEAGKLAQSLYKTDAPLTAAQAVQVADLLARHSPRFRDGKNASWRDVEWEDAIAEAAQFLSPRQLRELEVIRLSREVRGEQERAENAAAGGKSP